VVVVVFAVVVVGRDVVLVVPAVVAVVPAVVVFGPVFLVVCPAFVVVFCCSLDSFFLFAGFIDLQHKILPGFANTGSTRHIFSWFPICFSLPFQNHI
jgi:hypothetical protein